MNLSGKPLSTDDECLPSYSPRSSYASAFSPDIVERYRAVVVDCHDFQRRERDMIKGMDNERAAIEMRDLDHSLLALRTRASAEI